MEIQLNELRKSVKQNLDDLRPDLSLRIHSLLDDLLAKDLAEKESVDLFEMLVRLIFRADKEPASSIASLMVPVNGDTAYQLDEWTISNCAAFLRDYLKQDHILHSLDAKRENNGNTK